MLRMTPTLHLAEKYTKKWETSTQHGLTQKGLHKQGPYNQASLTLSALRRAFLGHRLLLPHRLPHPMLTAPTGGN